MGYLWFAVVVEYDLYHLMFEHLLFLPHSLGLGYSCFFFFLWICLVSYFFDFEFDSLPYYCFFHYYG